MMDSLLVQSLILAAGIGILYYGAEWLVGGAARLAASLGVSPIVVGLTVVSFGTSAPELVVSVVSALRGSADLAVGNVLGSNLANLGLILGLAALISPLAVAARVVSREVPLMLLVTLALFPLAADEVVGRGEGALLLLGLGAYIIFVLKAATQEPAEVLHEYEDFMREEGQAANKVSLRDVGLVVLGCAALVGGGYAIVESAVFIAGAMGVPQVVIGLTVVAVGTSLPELATSVVAAVKQEADIAVGNIVGSNIFNILGILGAAAVLAPLQVASTLVTRELVAVLAMSVLALPMLRTGLKVQRWEGALLMGAYVGLGIWLL